MIRFDPRHRNAAEFRHVSWRHEDVFAAFQDTGLIFSSVSAPRRPDDVIKSIYGGFHGAKQWYRHDYSDAELEAWTRKIRASRANEVWACFNNDFQGCAFRNAQALDKLLGKAKRRG